MATVQNKKILVIDDDKDIMEAIRIMLETEGFAVESASNGKEGFEKAGSCDPDLILIDGGKGQLNMARKIPGKEEFDGLVDWFATMVDRTGVNVRLGTEPSVSDLSGYDEVIVATGVLPRDPGIEGEDSPNVLSYIDVLRGDAKVGPRVAIVGAGGIGFDVAEFLVHEGESPTEDIAAWKAEWGFRKEPDLALCEGQQGNLTITVTNTGNVKVSNIVVTDELPVGWTSCGVVGGGVTVDHGARDRAEGHQGQVDAFSHGTRHHRNLSAEGRIA